MKMLHRNFPGMLLALVLALSNVLFVPVIVASDMYSTHEQPSSDQMLADALLVRPLMIGATAVGIVTFVVTLPFSVLGGNVDEAAKALVLEPAGYTFVRPLGDI
jgi:hypothetical protein